MRRLTVFSCIAASLFACSTAKTAVKTDDGLFKAADGSDWVALQAIGHPVKVPGPEWQAFRNAKAVGSDRTLDLFLRNRRTGANISCVLYPSVERSSATMAENLRTAMEQGGAATSSVDFSDETGNSARFDLEMNEVGRTLKGKVVVLRLTDGSGAGVAVYGIWPAKLDEVSSQAMETVVSSLVSAK